MLGHWYMMMTVAVVQLVSSLECAATNHASSISSGGASMGQSNDNRAQLLHCLVKGIAFLLVVVLVLVSVVALFTELWVFKMWPGLSLDELLFHLSVSASGTSPEILKGFLWNYGLSVFVVMLALVITASVIKEDQRVLRAFAVMLVFASVLTLGWVWNDADNRLALSNHLRGNANLREEPLVGEQVRREPLIAELTRKFLREAEMPSSVLMTPQLELVNPSSLADLVVDANNVTVTFPEERRNLIYLFLESMELTYSDVSSGGAFEQDHIPELTKLGMSYEDFSGPSTTLNGAIPLPGATWTSGAMFAQTAGLPLRMPIEYDGSQYNEFIPNVRTLGDVLADAGYRQMLLIGSDAAFGARDLLFTDHGGFELYDYYRAVEEGDIPEDYFVFWGYEDEVLFSIAKEQLEELSAGSEPFNLTMLTVDTHFPDGYLCDSCSSEYDDQYSNVIACSSKQVAEFVSWVQEQPFYKDTTIVICGDHLTMAGDYCTDVPDEFRRRTFTCIINPAVETDARAAERVYSTFDMYPTTLAALGAHVEGERLGLGTNLFSRVPTLCEAYGVDQMRDWTGGVEDLYDLFAQEGSTAVAAE